MECPVVSYISRALIILLPSFGWIRKEASGSILPSLSWRYENPFFLASSSNFLLISVSEPGPLKIPLTTAFT